MLLDFISFSQRLCGIAFCYNATLLFVLFNKKMRNALTFNVNETFSTGDNATKSYKNDVKKDHERKKSRSRRGGEESQKRKCIAVVRVVVARNESTTNRQAEWE